MGLGVCRLGYDCSGHGCWPPRVNDEASPNVFANGVAVHRQSDHWVNHTCVTTHDGVLQTGSSSVFVNGLPVARIGDPIDCGSTVAEGSSTVFAG